MSTQNPDTQNPVGKTLLVPIVVRADASVYTHRLGPSVVVREPDLFDPIKEDFEVLDVDVVPGQGRVCLAMRKNRESKLARIIFWFFRDFLGIFYWS